MTTKIAIESLSMDLLRVALGLHRGSFSVSERFSQEAFNRSQELKHLLMNDPYAKRLLIKTINSLRGSNSSKKAEELLMYSILFKNLAQFKYPT